MKKIIFLVGTFLSMALIFQVYNMNFRNMLQAYEANFRNYNNEFLAREVAESQFERITSRLAFCAEQDETRGRLQVENLVLAESYPILDVRRDLHTAYTEMSSFEDILAPSHDWLFVIRNNGNAEFFVIVRDWTDWGYNEFAIAMFGEIADLFDSTLENFRGHFPDDRIKLLSGNHMAEFSFMSECYEGLMDIPDTPLELSRSRDGFSLVMSSETVAEIFLEQAAERAELYRLHPYRDIDSPYFDRSLFDLQFGGRPPRLHEMYLEHMANR